MKIDRRKLLLAVSAAAAMAAPATAQDQFPSRPVTLVVPFPPGGAVDRVARTVGQKMAGPLGVPVIVENKAGAGGTIGAAFAARAWWGLFAPAGTPPEIVQALADALATALKDPALRSTLEGLGRLHPQAAATIRNSVAFTTGRT